MVYTVYFDSRKRDKNIFPYATDCETYFNMITADKLYVDKVILLNSFYNIPETTINQDGNDLQIIAGYYSGDEFASYLQTLFISIEVSYSYTTFKFSFHNIGMTTTTITVKDDLKKILGFSGYYSVLASDWTATYDLAQLQGSSFYIIEIENLIRDIKGTIQPNSLIVPNSESVGNIITEDTNAIFTVPGKNLNKLRVKLYDEDKNLIHSKIEWLFICKAL